ncbi:unnamed protein product [Gadus morhua 'NCC']
MECFHQMKVSLEDRLHAPAPLWPPQGEFTMQCWRRSSERREPKLFTCMSIRIRWAATQDLSWFPGLVSSCGTHTPVGGCDCVSGYEIPPEHIPVNGSYGCVDIDECFNSTVCGPRSNCTNVPGKHICQCEPGYIATDPSTAPDEDNTCEGI